MRRAWLHSIRGMCAAAAALVVAGCGATTTGGTASGGVPPASQQTCNPQGRPVTFADTSFTSLWVDTAVAKFIITNGYCIPTTSLTVTTPIMWKSLQDGQIDVMMELWQNQVKSVYEQAVKSGKLVDLGPIYNKSWQGWFVPKYVVDGNAARGIKASAPGLHSVSQLKNYWKVFQDPHNPTKGLFVDCITGWDCAIQNDMKLHAYGLDKYYDVEQAGTEAAMKAAIVGAVKKGKPVFFYWWGPTSLLGQYSFIQLQEPAFNAHCLAIQDQGIAGKIQVNQAPKAAGCAYQSYAVDKGAWSGFVRQYPQLAQFLRKMNVGVTPLLKACAYMVNNSSTAEQAGVWYLQHYKSIWEKWVPASVAARVNRALATA